jgi:opacity protein-like surface antigen
MRTIFLACLLAVAAPAALHADERHPMMDSKWWLTAGSFLADRDFDASASGTVAGLERRFDLEGSLGLDDSPSLFMGELGWQFAEKWGVALQYFRSTRSGSRVLEESFEWQDETYDVGARLEAGTKMEITRIFFARRFRDDGPHSLRLGAGVHWLSMSAEVAGEATLNDASTEFRRSAATAEFPVPNIGAWYRYSPNERWIFNARLDWLSAKIDNYSGDIWNASGGIGYKLWKNIGIGANYQYFQLAGDLTEDNWRGAVKTTFTGPYVYVSGYW